MKKYFVLAFLLLASVASAQVLEVPNFNLIPAGTILMHGGSSAPTGYFLCDGRTASTTAYYSLFLAIGYTYGGSGVNFKVPDLRGAFPKGFGQNGTLGANYANASGTPDADSTYVALNFSDPGHSHTLNAPNGVFGYVGPSLIDVGTGAGNYSAVYSTAGSGTGISASLTQRYGAVTEPANVGVNFIIKY